MSGLEMLPNPERFAPGAPWSTHDWNNSVPLWEDEAWWCRDCGAASFHDEADKPCSGRAPGRAGPSSFAVVVTAVRERGGAA
ncbi:hypothetical protein [Streptomyces xanthochromogenes]|uniref:hypothetical protein n=1 Tax=Streptomyces xanthochromogenes TaxID=67384 RepID=UPI002F4079DC